MVDYSETVEVYGIKVGTIYIVNCSNDDPRLTFTKTLVPVSGAGGSMINPGFITL